MSSSAQVAFQRSTIRSVQACGSSPPASAALATFWPCSSVPVRNSTLSPWARRHRASTSAAMVV
jgi:hypothetical protein